MSDENENKVPSYMQYPDLEPDPDEELTQEDVIYNLVEKLVRQLMHDLVDGLSRHHHRRAEMTTPHPSDMSCCFRIANGCSIFTSDGYGIPWTYTWKGRRAILHDAICKPCLDTMISRDIAGISPAP